VPEHFFATCSLGLENALQRHMGNNAQPVRHHAIPFARKALNEPS
jgi:hypothetical protein